MSYVCLECNHFNRYHASTCPKMLRDGKQFHENSTMATFNLLRPKDIAYLGAAIQEAESWKGSLMPEDYPAFDARIREMREALRRAKNTRKRVTELQAANKRLSRSVENLL